MCQTCDKLLQVNINWCQWMWIDVNWCQDMSRYVKVCKVFKVLVQGSSCSPHSWSASHPRTTVTSPGPNDPRYHSMLGSPVLHRPVLVTLSLYVTNMSLFHTISYDFFFDIFHHLLIFPPVLIIYCLTPQSRDQTNFGSIQQGNLTLSLTLGWTFIYIYESMKLYDNETKN